MNKYMETSSEGMGNKGNSRINIYSNKIGEVPVSIF